MVVTDGATVIFLGDSLTEQYVAVSRAAESQTGLLPVVGSSVIVDAWEHRGYALLVQEIITARYPERQIRWINAGVGGNTSRNLLTRLRADVLAHRPDWVLIAIGINDVWRLFQPGRESEGVPLAEFQNNITRLVERVLAARAQPILIEAPPFATGSRVDQSLAKALNRQLDAHNTALAEIAEAYRLRLVPANRAFKAVLAARRRHDPAFSLHADEAHLNRQGQMLLALTVVATLEATETTDRKRISG